MKGLKGLKRELNVFTMDVQLKRSELRVSNSKVFNSVPNIKKKISIKINNPNFQHFLSTLFFVSPKNLYLSIFIKVKRIY